MTCSHLQHYSAISDLIATLYFDIPYLTHRKPRPTDMIQREGRILRQGNLNQNVQIFRYITEGSFDAYSWQLLETKQRFIDELLSGSLCERSGSDVEDTALSYAEVKALAVGNPLIKLRVETANELGRYLTLQRKLVESRQNMEQTMLELPAKIERQRERIEWCENDIAALSRERTVSDKERRRAIRERIHSAVRANTGQPSDRTLMSYRGFSIILPQNMINEKPFVKLQREGTYSVELGDTEQGVLVRIDNFMAGLPEHICKLRDNLDAMLDKKRWLETELSKTEGYSSQIEKCKARLDEFDKARGVEKR